MSKVRILSPRPENLARRKCGGFNFLFGTCGFKRQTAVCRGSNLLQNNWKNNLAPDEVMIELFSTEVGDDFMDKANKVDEYIWEQIALAVKTGQDVIYDAGSWSANDRKYVMQRLEKLGAEAL